MRMYVTAVDSSSVTFSIADAQSIVDLSYGGANWYAMSKIKFSGKVTGNTSGESIVFASTNGTVTANMNSTVNRLSINVPCADANKHFSVSSSSLIVDTISVMLYEIYISSENVYYPIGIYIKAYGSGNKSSYIDIYGGQSSQPTARLGLLNGLKDPEHPVQNLKINGLDVAGWGLMSDYAYLKGTIVSESGKIGGWTIGGTMLYNIPSNSAIGQDNSMFLGTAFPSTATGFGNPSIGGSSALNTWRITSGSKFGVTNDGTVYVSNIQASGGKIGGWTITSGNLSYGSIGTANGVFLIPAGSSTTVSIAGSGAINKWAITSGATFGVTTGGALYSTSGKIGGWAIGATSIYSGTNSMSSTTNGTYIGTDGFRNYKLVGTKGCYVDIADGKITANEADISGKITSSSGEIGGWKIGSSSIYSGTNSMISTAAGTYIGTDGYRNYTSADSYVNIANGKITANNVDLKGNINATSGSIGGCTISSGVLQIKDANITGTLSTNKISINDLSVFKATIGGITIGDSIGLYTNSKSASTSTASGFLISKDGAIYLGPYSDATGVKSCPFQVTSAGALTARSATIIGDITANTGKIGGANGWTISTDSIAKGTIGSDNSMHLRTSDLSANATVASRAGTDWRLTVGSSFGVTSTGNVYANNATLNDVSLKNVTAFRAYSIHGSPTGNLDERYGCDFDCIRANGQSQSSGISKLLGIGTEFITTDGHSESFVQPQCGIQFFQTSINSGSTHTNVINMFGDEITISGQPTNNGNNNTDMTIQGTITSSGAVTASSFSATNNGGTQYSIRYEKTANTYSSSAAIVITDAVTMGINNTDKLNSWVRYGPAYDSCLLMKPGNSQIFVRAKASANGSTVKVYNLADCLEAALEAGGAIWPYNSTPPEISASSGSTGNSNDYARGNHTHKIAVATGDSNGQIKIAGQNVSVKGLGSAAYNNSSAFATAGHTHPWSDITGTPAIPKITHSTRKKSDHTFTISSSKGYVLFVYASDSDADTGAYILKSGYTIRAIKKPSNGTISLSGTSLTFKNSSNYTECWLLELS